MKNKKKTGLKIIVNFIVWVISISSIFPLVWLAYSSLKTKGEFMIDTLSLPTELHFENYPVAFQMAGLWNAMSNSAFYVVVNVILVGTMALVVAYFIARYNFKGRSFIYYVFMLGMLVPLYALLVPMFLQYRILDMMNNRLTLIICYYAMCMPLAIFLYESFITGIPTEIDEASIVDGCGTLQRIFLIIFPLSRPIMATVGIITALQTWNEYGFSVVLTPTESLRTVSVALKTYSTGMEAEYTLLMAGLFVSSLPILLVYLFFSKYIVQGMVAGAVKG